MLFNKPMLLYMKAKVRPSMPMSPTGTWLGMPSGAMAAQFSNSNGGIGGLCFTTSFWLGLKGWL
jgi:hypothetical protein